MKYLIAPTWFANFFENESVLRTSRETRCRKVQLNRSQPEPPLVGFAPDKAPQFIDFGLQPEQVNLAAWRGRARVEVVGQLSVECGNELQQPSQAQPADAADAAQREPFEQQPLDERTGVVADPLRV